MFALDDTMAQLADEAAERIREMMRRRSDFDNFLESRPELQLTREQIACCRYLERQGLRFGVNFGYSNAPAIVWGEFDAEIEARRGQAPAGADCGL